MSLYSLPSFLKTLLNPLLSLITKIPQIQEVFVTSSQMAMGVQERWAEAEVVE